jgi:hypothetical protein
LSLKIQFTGDEQAGRFTKVLICGDAGVGKTRTSSTWPNPLFASAEGGLMSLRDRKIPFKVVHTSDDLQQIRALLMQAPEVREKMVGRPVDTIVIDTIDEIQAIFVRERLAEKKIEAMTISDWGWLGETMRSVVSGFRNLDMHVVMTCHLKETSDSDTGKLYFKPAMQGGISDQLPNYFDLSLWLRAQDTVTIVDGENVRSFQRWFQTYPDGMRSWIKDRSGTLPSELPANLDDDYRRIERLIFGDRESLPATESVEIPTSEANVSTTDVAEANPIPDPATTEKKAEKKAANKPPTEAEKTSVPETGTTLPTEKADVPSCDSCGKPVENVDQADMSQIKFQKTLCVDCFKEAYKSK